MVCYTLLSFPALVSQLHVALLLSLALLGFLEQAKLLSDSGILYMLISLPQKRFCLCFAWATIIHPSCLKITP